MPSDISDSSSASLFSVAIFKASLEKHIPWWLRAYDAELSELVLTKVF